MIASDFTDNSLTGIATVVGGFASITKILTNDISLEGAESFQVNIRFGSPSGSIVGTSPIIAVADTSVPSYEIVPSTLSINEEQSVTFTINTAGVPDNTTLYYTISGSSGLVAGDFDDNALSGSFVINSGTGTITKTLALDFTTEGNETFILIVRKGSTFGTIVATTPTITIVDTSISGYTFTSFNFTNAGATGRTGPTLAQCLSSYDTITYDWLTKTSFFNMTSQGKQLWTVKIGGVYEFDVRGARGGTYSNGGTTYTGAYGARIVSRVTLSVGQVIAIAVGQMGQDSTTYPTSGGGSFVVLDGTSTPLVVAGGGAGAGSNGGGNANTSAQGQITTYGGPPGSRGGGSGTNGGGGGGGRNTSGGDAADGASNGSYNQASGGAGFYGSGGEAYTGVNSRGLKWSLGMTGGYSSIGDTTLVGGFGGGAGMAPAVGAPGAGGYSGGGGAYYNYTGQGGGSFTTSSFSGTNITATQGFNSGHGSVSVTLISITESYVTRPSAQNVNEGSIVRFTTNTVGVANATLYYTIVGSAGIDAFDFTDNLLSGSFNTVSGVGTVTKTLSNDLSVGEGTETFYMNVSTGSTLGTVVSTSPTVYVYDTSTATFNITPSTLFVNEGSSVGFAVTTTNIPDNTTVYYTISGSVGISTTDFTDGALSGSFNIISNSATVTKTLVNDLSSNEGTETFNMSIRVGSIGGQIATTSSNVSVYDTSISPYVITPSTLNVNEGSSVIFTTNTTGISDTTLYYNISGSTGISASDFTSNSLTGSFPLVSGVGSTTLTLVNDLTTEGTETFYMNVRTGNPSSGPIVGVSSSVNINDTSLTPELFAFTSFTFTHGTWSKQAAAGSANPRQTVQSTASTGDSLATFKSIYNTSTYPWINNTLYYNVVTLGFQQWTCPRTGTYRIIVAGAAGGSHPSTTVGSGAVITADVSLTMGQIYTILVGKRGENTENSSNAGAGGGGGSFFFINATDTTPIIAAGGGGGACQRGSGVNVSLTTSGANGNGGSISGGAIGGINGGIPTVNSGDGDYDAGGGAGWLSGNGEINSNANDASFGYAPRNSGRGGLRSADGSDDLGGHGGFGGGGGGTTENGSAGGGGGYSGGGKGSNNTTYGGGGGGGSFSSGTFVSSFASNTGQGYVNIQFIAPPVAPPVAPIINIVTSGLVMNLDAGNTSSYSGSGTTWTDLSGNSNTGTLTNGPTYNSANSGSIVFDGSNDYINLPANSVNTNASLTLSFWIRTSSFATANTILSGLTNTGHLQIRFGTSITFVQSFIAELGGFAGFTPALNTIYNITITLTKGSPNDTCSLYVNGSFVSNHSYSTRTFTISQPVLGANFNVTEAFNGNMYNFMSYNRVLSGEEILQNYNALSERYYVTSGLVMYLDAAKTTSYPGSGTTWTDLSGNSNTGTLTNGPTYSSANSGSIVFDGTDDKVDCGNASSLQITQGTISTWINANSGNSNYNGIITKQLAWSLFVKDNILISYDWGNVAERTTGITVGNGTWNHIAMTFTETVGTPTNNAIIYVNGSPVLTTTVRHSAQSAPVQIGDGNNTSQNFGGNVSQTLIYNRALSASEVAQNYNAFKGRYSIVTTGLVLNLDAGNTSSYPGSGTTWTDLIGGNNATLTNGPTYSGANGGSIVFDGSNDYANIGVGKGVNQFSADFTVSAWVMADSTGSTFGNIIGDYYTNSISTTNEWQLMMNNGAQISFYRVGTGSIFNIASGYSANTWINVVVSRIGSTIILYTNSNSIATATNSDIFGTATGNFNIGIDGNNTVEPFKGKIANVLIYKNKGLSASEVLQNFNALRGRYGI
jgi:hypothetical protein